MTFRGMRSLIFLVVSAAAAACAPSARAQAPSAELETGSPDILVPKQLEGIDVQEHLGGPLPLDAKFVDDNGRVVALADYFSKGRPVLLSMNYSSCPMLCSAQLTRLVEALRQMTLSAGTDYHVVSVSLNPDEPLEQAASAKQRYVQEYGKVGGEAGWHFLTGQQDEITRLAQALGIKYRRVEGGHDFAHPTVLAVCSPEGKISRYLYGIGFEPQTLRLSMVEASEGKVGTTIDRIILSCFAFDHSSGQYTVMATRLLRGAALITIVGLASIVGFFLWRERRRARTRPFDAGSIALTQRA